jgi:phage terminase large subunit-like protein
MRSPTGATVQLSEWLEVERHVDRSQVYDEPALIDRLPRSFVEGLGELEALELSHDPSAYLRARQLPPADREWLTWAIVTGRSWGKSFAAAAWVASQLVNDPGDYLLCAPSLQLVEDLQWSVIEPLIHPSIRVVPRLAHQQILFPDLGSRLFFHSAEVTHARGKNLRGAWLEEVIAWPGGGRALWKNLRRALRAPGETPARAVITTTPPFTLDHWLIDVIADPTTRTTRGTARDNPHVDRRNIESWYSEDTIESRRENDGAFIFGVDGALFKLETIETSRLDAPPALAQVVVSLDPTQSNKADADTVGLVAMGIARGHAYVLESTSERMSPEQWATRAIDMAQRHRASAYLVEPTGSGFLPETILKQQFKILNRGQRPIIASKAQGPKVARAQPLAALAAAGRMHVIGHQEALERELTTWHPGATFSPGALDAAAHAWLHLSYYGMGNQ